MNHYEYVMKRMWEMRKLFLEFIDTAEDDTDEDAWRQRLYFMDNLLDYTKKEHERSKEVQKRLSRITNAVEMAQEALK